MPNLCCDALLHCAAKQAEECYQSCSMMCNGPMKYSALVGTEMQVLTLAKRGAAGVFPIIIISFSIYLIFLCPILLLSISISGWRACFSAVNLMI